MTPTNSTVSKEDQGRDEGTAINQTSTEADEMVLLPLGTLRALQNEVAELRNMFVMFKKDTAKQLESYGDALNARLASDETETNASDEGGDRSMQVDLGDLAARKVAVRRVRRLARDYHSGKERAHLEFMVDIVGVKNKSKVDSRLVQVASRLQRLTVMTVTPRPQPSNDSRSRDMSLCQATPPRRLCCLVVETYI